MSSLSTDAKGNRSIQFVGPQGRKRRTIRLGKVPKKTAESVRTRIEHLVAAGASRLPLDLETSNWVAGVGEDLAAKLAAGLIPRRQSAKLGEFLEGYVARRRADSKGTTVCNIERACLDMAEQFGADSGVRAITPAMADDLATHYAARAGRGHGGAAAESLPLGVRPRPAAQTLRGRPVRRG